MVDYILVLIITCHVFWARNMSLMHTIGIHCLQMFETHYQLQKQLPVGVDDSKRVEAALKWLEENDGWLLVIEDATMDSRELVQDIISRGRGRTVVTSVAEAVVEETEGTLRLPLRCFESSEDCKCYWRRMKVCATLLPLAKRASVCLAARAGLPLF